MAIATGTCGICLQVRPFGPEQLCMVLSNIQGVVSLMDLLAPDLD